MPKLVAVVIFGFILAGPHLAEATCAWVLWANYGSLDPSVPFAFSTVKGSPSGWQPAEVFDTAQACQTALRKADEHEWDIRFKRNEKKPKGELWDAYVYRCLPDTIDPRGPKGSGR